MTEKRYPPKWADRLLSWYCNPELLEEIQGDAWQLYFERLRTEGKVSADWKYIWDVIRFFRWSNIRKPARGQNLASRRALWNFNFKLAVRHASKHKMIFGIKITGLASCLAFGLLLTAYIVNELTFDQFHRDHQRIYRVVSTVKFPDHTTNYAVTPLPMGKALVEGIPEIESYFRFMYEEKPVFRIEDKLFYNDKALAVDSNFLRRLSFDFVKGSANALDDPDKVVLTETLARKFFGEEDPIGQTVELDNNMLLEVAGIMKDVPRNSHLRFDALISWDSYQRYDAWGNLNAYTYIVLQRGADIRDVQQKMPSVLSTFHELIARDYNATYEPVFENITDIHFSGYLDEDIAEKRNKTNVHILIVVVIVFLLTGLVNYLNLTLTEITSNLKKIGIIRVFGGLNGGHHKLFLSDTFFTVLLIVPMTGLLFWLGLNIARSILSIEVNADVIRHPFFLATAGGFVVLLAISSRVNGAFLSRSSQVVRCLQGKLSKAESGTGPRKMLVCIQLSFSITIIAMISIIVDQFHFIENADKGFEGENTIVIKLPSEVPGAVETFTNELRHVAGISKADGSSYYPGIIETKYVFEVETEKGMKQVLVPMIRCGYDYLDVLSISTVEGRPFQLSHASDRYESYMINETAAREFGWKKAVGKTIRGPLSGSNEAYREGAVIGVARDFNFASLHNRIDPVIMFLTDENWSGQFVYAKLEPLRPDNLIPVIEQKFKEHWPEHPFDWEFLDSKYTSLYSKDIEVKKIFETGLIISLIISCLGIFSVSGLVMALRLKEIGIRKVMGATTLQLFYLHITGLMRASIISIVLACPIIWLASEQWLQNFAYHIEMNVKYFAFPAAAALFITLFMSGYHAVKGSQVNLASTLKHE